MDSAQRITLGPELSIDRLVVGTWQTTASFGSVERSALLDAYGAFLDAGFGTFDTADIYKGSESFLRELRARQPQSSATSAPTSITVMTKWVPMGKELDHLTLGSVEAAIDRSRHNLGVESIDLLHCHWWDYAIDGLTSIFESLTALRAARKIRELGVTNMDTPRTEALLVRGIPLRTAQVQYSLLDRRPARHLAGVVRAADMSFICYGGLAGGLISEKWLHRGPPDGGNPSLVKYLRIVAEFGGWSAFQELLAVLKTLANRYDTDISAIALRWLLDQPGVAAAIVGARDAKHLSHLQQVFAIELTHADHEAIQNVLTQHPGPTGDVYEQERNPASPLCEVEIANRGAA